MTTTEVYPSAFNYCVLTCWLDAGRKACALYFENTMDTWHIQLELPEDLFSDGGSRFKCDMLEAHDGGPRYLTVYDATLMRGEDLTTLPARTRRKMMQEALFKSDGRVEGSCGKMTDEFRLIPARLFPTTNVKEILSYHVPNHPGVCHGFAFLDDNFNPHFARTDDGWFVVRKSRYPDVYELYEDGVHPIPGNNVAYIPTLSLSQRLREIFKNKNSTSLHCVYNAQRQKWVPNLDVTSSGVFPG
jgi:hypothetical protein